MPDGKIISTIGSKADISSVLLSIYNNNNKNVKQSSANKAENTKGLQIRGENPLLRQAANEREHAILKASGFVIEGAQINGYVGANGIAINIGSQKALNSVVGHEIAHVLEVQ